MQEEHTSTQGIRKTTSKGVPRTLHTRRALAFDRNTLRAVSLPCATEAPKVLICWMRPVTSFLDVGGLFGVYLKTL